ncbi:MAG TPA: hypothetical protein VGO50_11865 [Pyrinomonadaceae bacterium]|jgi:hypothetical protein|nr:hypothetical protein [Pyrinomonadaceae bacterium]
MIPDDGRPNSFDRAQYAVYLAAELDKFGPYVKTKLPDCLNNGCSGNTCVREVLDNLKKELLEKHDRPIWGQSEEDRTRYLKGCLRRQAVKVYRKCSICDRNTVSFSSDAPADIQILMNIRTDEHISSEYEEKERTCRFLHTLDESEITIIVNRAFGIEDENTASSLGCSVKTVQNKRSLIWRKYEVFE